MTTHMHRPAHAGPATAPLASPVRNLYPYGKLLDGPHLEMEQDYHSGLRRLMNRLTVGAGVVCGLRVRATDAGLVAVEPGVALDGLGREIVVDRTVTIEDPWALTDECGRPSGRRVEGGPVLLCIEHHECPVEPIPALVAGCDVHEECVPGSMRETFRVTVREDMPAPPGLTPEQCRAIFGGPVDDGRPYDEPAAGGGSGIRPVGPSHGAWAGDVPRRLGRVRMARAAGGQARASADLRARVCEALAGPCPDGRAGCVPLALVRRDEGGAVEVEGCAVRTPIYSNAVLLDLILCLAARVEECCARRPPVTAPPVVRALFPSPAQVLTPAELGRPLGGKPGLVVVFDRAMDPAHLAAPGGWLRLWRIGPPTDDGRVDVQRAELTFVEATSLGPVEDAAVYHVGQDMPVGSRWLIQVRAEAGAIADAATPARELDADLAATGLDAATLGAIWDVEADQRPRDVYDRLADPPDPAGPSALPSGDGDEGGRLASWFELAGGR